MKKPHVGETDPPLRKGAKQPRVDPPSIRFSHTSNHWSVNFAGRLFFGALALLAASSFALFLVLIMFVKTPTTWAAVVMQGSIGACLLVAAIFLFLAAIHAWFPTKWSERWLIHYLPRGGVMVVLFVVAVIAHGVMTIK